MKAHCPLMRPVRVAVALCALFTAAPAFAGELRQDALDTMKRATRFMVEKVANKGGYVWSYLPDMSRRWGEMEATETMVWVQPPGTATMGHLFLDAYHATGDEYYYRAAEQAADALILGQHESGGWNYLIDFAGEESLRRWYDTVGRNAWRLEEFQHYSDSATFDDAGTAEASQFLLRMYVEKQDERFRPALDKALSFVLSSQYPTGGWPQRFPVQDDYSAYVTFNDDVAAQNIKFMILYWQALGDARVLDPIRRAMDSFIATQLPPPQAGWALQYTPDLKPAGARSYEPNSLVTSTTGDSIRQLMDFYELTGDPKYLAPIPAALDWLDRVRLPADQVKNGRTHPTFVELGTDRPLYVHRRGSNVVNGAYYVDYDPANVITHYSGTRAVDVAGLRTRYERLKATPPDEAAKTSPLRAEGTVPLPRYFALRPIEVSDLNSNAGEGEVEALPEAELRKLIAGLNAEGWWPTPLRATSNPYAGPGSPTPAPGDYSMTRVGDRTDTSPYIAETPVTGISTGVYIQNMAALIRQIARP